MQTQSNKNHIISYKFKSILTLFKIYTTFHLKIFQAKKEFLMKSNIHSEAYHQQTMKDTVT